MLSWPATHKPEGFEDARTNVVETVHEMLKEEHWVLLGHYATPDAPVVATIGSISHGLPEIVLGWAPSGDEFPVWEEHIADMYAFLRAFGKGSTDGWRIDALAFWNFTRDEGEPAAHTLADLPVYARELRLVKIDPDQWYAGFGWQHAQWYTEEERAKGEIYQFVGCDEHGRFPGDEGFAQIQLLFPTKPFGDKSRPALTDLQKARNRFLN